MSTVIYITHLKFITKIVNNIWGKFWVMLCWESSHHADTSGMVLMWIQYEISLTRAYGCAVTISSRDKTWMSVEGLYIMPCSLLFSSSVEEVTPTLMGPLEWANLNHWTTGQVSAPSPEDGSTSSFQNVNIGRWAKSKNPVILKAKLGFHWFVYL
jgi:hypothetical protein